MLYGGHSWGSGLLALTARVLGPRAVPYAEGGHGWQSMHLGNRMPGQRFCDRGASHHGRGVWGPCVVWAMRSFFFFNSSPRALMRGSSIARCKPGGRRPSSFELRQKRRLLEGSQFFVVLEATPKRTSHILGVLPPPRKRKKKREPATGRTKPGTCATAPCAWPRSRGSVATRPRPADASRRGSNWWLSQKDFLVFPPGFQTRDGPHTKGGDNKKDKNKENKTSTLLVTKLVTLSCEELRELTNSTVREYHQTYYRLLSFLFFLLGFRSRKALWCLGGQTKNEHADRPDNLCVIVTGQVPFKQLCEACAPTVAAIRGCPALPPMERRGAGGAGGAGSVGCRRCWRCWRGGRRVWGTEALFFGGAAAHRAAGSEAWTEAPVQAVRCCVAPRRMEFPAEDETTGAVCELCWHGPGTGGLDHLSPM